MANLQTMYPGVANSPDTFLIEGLTIDGTVMYVADGAVFGEIPTLAVIGQTELAETVQITGKQSDGGYTIVRGVEGKRQAWAKATNVARNWTNKDYETLRSNITAINDGKVDKVAGKGLSTNDYDDEAKAKVDAIPPDPKYTDTVPDLSPYAKKDDIPDLSPYAKAADLSKEQDERKKDVGGVNASIQGVADIIMGEINTAKATHDADIKRLDAQKLNKTDIVNDLTTGGADKALSAEQGKALFTYADNGKKSIADSIVGKGVDATKADSFGVLADKISKIKTGYGVGDVLPEESVEVQKTPIVPKKIWEFTGHTGGVDALTVSPDGFIYSGGDDSKIFKISPDGRKVWEFSGHTKRVWSVEVALDGSIYGGGEDDKIFKISPDGRKIWEYQWPGRFLRDLAVSPDGSIYGCGFDCKVAKISPDGKQVWRFDDQPGSITALAIGPDGSIYSGDNKHKVFKISSSGQKVWEFAGHTDAVYCLTVSPDGFIYSGGADKKVFKISPDGRKVWEFSGYTGDVFALAVGSDGSIYSGADFNYIFKLSSSGQELWRFKKTNTELRSLAVGPDGSIYSGDNKFFSDQTGYRVTKFVDYTTSYKIIK